MPARQQHRGASVAGKHSVHKRLMLGVNIPGCGSAFAQVLQPDHPVSLGLVNELFVQAHEP